MTKKSTRKTPQQTTHSLEKNSRHKKLDTLSSSQTTHSQEKPTNQTSLHAFLKAPENLTTKISDLSTRLAMNQATTVQKPCLGKIPIATKPEPVLNHQPLAAAGTILTPHTPNPSTQKHVHHNTLFDCLSECLPECALEIPICAGKRLSEPANTYLSGKYLPEPVNTYPH